MRTGIDFTAADRQALEAPVDVRLLSTSGRTVEQVADDRGIGRSALTKWKSRLAEAELMAGPLDDVHKELERLRRENELLRAERNLLKKATAFFAKKASR